jgi:hypothetical protein
MAGVSYLIIFFAAIFANFFVVEAILSEPMGTVRDHPLMVRMGILAFMITVIFDVIVAWALYELYKEHPLSSPAKYFRIMHATIMGVAIFALPAALLATTPEEVLHQINQFNTIWLIGLFFFGVHLILLSRILGKPRFIAIFIAIAGVMYMVDTTAHFLLSNYDQYADIFLPLVAIPSIFGEMALAIWLLVKGGAEK